MPIRNILTWISKILLVIIVVPASFAENDNDGLGQIIQINTRFHSFVGKPSWLIIIRDLDNQQNVPYLFDITRGENFWLIFTHSKNYLITTSRMQISTYQSRCNDFGSYELNDFCHLESHGRIIRGESLYITIDGALSSKTDSVSCHISRFADPNFSVAPQHSSE